jgi:hypothetical protein
VWKNWSFFSAIFYFRPRFDSSDKLSSYPIHCAVGYVFIKLIRNRSKSHILVTHRKKSIVLEPYVVILSSHWNFTRSVKNRPTILSGILAINPWLPFLFRLELFSVISENDENFADTTTWKFCFILLSSALDFDGAKKWNKNVNRWKLKFLRTF